MHGRYGNLDYPRLTKLFFLLGLGCFVVGEAGEYALDSGLVTGPQWEYTLLVWLTVGGILVALLSPFVFGIVLPLTE